ncbi:Hsp70 family protein [Rhizobium leguminosarum]|uniref:Molecular chaperone heat shock protein (HSP70) n=1 Tax=Rhizobium leguminosarum bv. trifolii (strain WSM1325) TaxID=395491 RepID=C6ASY2_RHILS|nr:Hsp70 family protein [Rhizobium leguminosarum]ACS55381.1 molecular chaperone heat shock protein (HSP70) [Rhizobium leguminosarum bv. trifolii WSM1325]MBY2909587.1 Hsp70 family protein [Rhizobium leguminosarum]MBY2932095.1 Hsp70 family protein [Rhizobium leguminosarum]MBY2949818.1 Hsp70 family protein [Rhizobium leguminosarum]MBY2965914.1 Hsp70 family protein [Rhizobium leguminosarum]
MAQALGFDFGTTNTVLATADGGATRSMAFTSTEGTADSMRTALSFMKDAQLGASALKVEAGHAAIRQFIDNPGECRFLQSIKTFAASALFQGTLIFAKRHNFEDLMEVFVRRLRNYAGDNWPSDVSRIVTGRPVHFAGASPDPALATERYNEALSRFGFPEIHYVYEPVAAAFYFAQNLKRDATVLVADFGGGTTDYSLIRFETVAGKLTAMPIGHSGVGVAGDHFDYRMIDNIVAPLIGKGSHFKSFDKILEVPSNYYSSFGRWNQLSIFKTTREFEDLKKLVRTSLEPEKLEIFIDLIDHDEGYPLYQAVSATKMALSASEEAPFDFAPLGRGGHRSIKRSDFEGWIADDLARIEGALDDVLDKTETKPSEIDKVFLTGGTSFVPAVRRIFTERFERDRIESGGELLSIAHGLALIGERDDIAQWTVQ